MTSSDRRLTGGVDAHGDTHDAAALEERGRRLGSRTFTTDAAGQWALLA
jgi:transposase